MASMLRRIKVRVLNRSVVVILLISMVVVAYFINRKYLARFREDMEREEQEQRQLLQKSDMATQTESRQHKRIVRNGSLKGHRAPSMKQDTVLAKGKDVKQKYGNGNIADPKHPDLPAPGKHKRHKDGEVAKPTAIPEMSDIKLLKHITGRKGKGNAAKTQEINQSQGQKVRIRRDVNRKVPGNAPGSEFDRVIKVGNVAKAHLGLKTNKAHAGHHPKLAKGKRKELDVNKGETIQKKKRHAANL